MRGNRGLLSAAMLCAAALSQPIVAHAQNTAKSQQDAAIRAREETAARFDLSVPQCDSVSATPEQTARWGGLLKLNRTIWQTGDQVLSFRWDCTDPTSLYLEDRGMWERNGDSFSYRQEQGALVDSRKRIFVPLRNGFLIQAKRELRRCEIAKAAINCTHSVDIGGGKTDPKTGIAAPRWQVQEIRSYKPADPRAARNLSHHTLQERHRYPYWAGAVVGFDERFFQKFQTGGQRYYPEQAGWKGPRSLSINDIGDRIQIATFDASGAPEQFAEFRKSPGSRVLPVAAQLRSPFAREEAFTGPLEIAMYGSLILSTKKSRFHLTMSLDRDAMMVRDMRWDARRGWTELSRVTYRQRNDLYCQGAVESFVVAGLVGPLWRTALGYESYGQTANGFGASIYNASGRLTGNCTNFTKTADKEFTCTGTVGINRKSSIAIRVGNLSVTGFSRDGITYRRSGGREGIPTSFTPSQGSFFTMAEWPRLASSGIQSELAAEARAEAREQAAERRDKRRRERENSAALGRMINGLNATNAANANNRSVQMGGVSVQYSVPAPANPTREEIANATAYLQMQQMKEKDARNAARNANKKTGETTKPLIFMLVTNPPIFNSDTRQPICYSNAITVPGPPGWGGGREDMGALHQLQSVVDMKKIFVARCATMRNDSRVADWNSVSVYPALGPDMNDMTQIDAMIETHRSAGGWGVTM
jgi:hypothetical protein